MYPMLKVVEVIHFVEQFILDGNASHHFFWSSNNTIIHFLCMHKPQKTVR
uniref:Uncharacterized protein n=1 Tax=Manihot esculenta TaxID=3983 RepID=A0A2C9U8M0_MANES